eukprot:4090348-Amphidinium_carterae.1
MIERVLSISRRKPICSFHFRGQPRGNFQFNRVVVMERFVSFCRRLVWKQTFLSFLDETTALP